MRNESNQFNSLPGFGAMKQLGDKYMAAGFGREFAWMDLANSLEWNGFGQLTDHLQNHVWLRDMLKHWNLASGIPRPIPMDNIVALRALLRRLAAKVHSEASLRARDIAALNAYLNVAVRVKLFLARDALRSELVPLEPGWPWILARIAASFGDMQALARPDRLKYCVNEGCKWIFYDQTKANTRRWCNDRTCGNRDRVRRARARKNTTPKRPAVR